MNCKIFTTFSLISLYMCIDYNKVALSNSGITFEADKSDELCQTNTDTQSKCVHIKDCNVKYDKERPKVCSWEGNLPFICCPQSRSANPVKLTANPECGRQPSDNPTSIAKRDLLKHLHIHRVLVGGKEVSPFSWPWMVSIHQKTHLGESYLCGGCIISDLYILTAAHCFGENTKPASDYLIKTQEIRKKFGISEEVENIKLHPDYKNGQHYNDIAVMSLKSPLKFNDEFMPACLPSQRDYSNEGVTVLGWGDTSYAGSSSDVLQEAVLKIIPNADCNASYSKLRSSAIPKGVTEDFLCAGLIAGGKDACQGDSGGPLMTISLRWSVVGIVSFGYQCARAGYPGIYTKVYNYLQWIIDNTNLIV